MMDDTSSNKPIRALHAYSLQKSDMRCASELLHHGNVTTTPLLHVDEIPKELVDKLLRLDGKGQGFYCIQCVKKAVNLFQFCSKKIRYVCSVVKPGVKCSSRALHIDQQQKAKLPFILMHADTLPLELVQKLLDLDAMHPTYYCKPCVNKIKRLGAYVKILYPEEDDEESGSTKFTVGQSTGTSHASREQYINENRCLKSILWDLLEKHLQLGHDVMEKDVIKKAFLKHVFTTREEILDFLRIEEYLQSSRMSSTALNFVDPLVIEPEVTENEHEPLKTREVYDSSANEDEPLETSEVHDPSANENEPLETSKVYDPSANMANEDEPLETSEVHDPSGDVYSGMNDEESVKSSSDICENYDHTSNVLAMKNNEESVVILSDDSENDEYDLSVKDEEESDICEKYDHTSEVLSVKSDAESVNITSCFCESHEESAATPSVKNDHDDEESLTSLPHVFGDNDSPMEDIKSEANSVEEDIIDPSGDPIVHDVDDDIAMDDIKSETHSVEDKVSDPSDDPIVHDVDDDISMDDINSETDTCSVEEEEEKDEVSEPSDERIVHDELTPSGGLLTNMRKDVDKFSDVQTPVGSRVEHLSGWQDPRKEQKIYLHWKIPNPHKHGSKLLDVKMIKPFKPLLKDDNSSTTINAHIGVEMTKLHTFLHKDDGSGTSTKVLGLKRANPIKRLQKDDGKVTSTKVHDVTITKPTVPIFKVDGTGKKIVEKFTHGSFSEYHRLYYAFDILKRKCFYTCHMCSKFNHSILMLENHFRTWHSPVPYQLPLCPICADEKLPTDFQTRDIVNHMWVAHGVKHILCLTCFRYFSCITTYREHQRTHTFDALIYRCGLCLDHVVYPDKETFLDHLDHHAESYTCIDCATKDHYRYSNLVAFNQHVIEKHDITPMMFLDRCSICLVEVDYNSREGLKAHLTSRMHKESREAYLTRQNCSHCRVPTGNWLEFQLHMQISHHEENGGATICLFCEFTACTVNAMCQHRLSHFSQCELCRSREKNYPQRQSIQNDAASSEGNSQHQKCTCKLFVNNEEVINVVD